jgi:hypothetical protein
MLPVSFGAAEGFARRDRTVVGTDNPSILRGTGRRELVEKVGHALSEMEALTCGRARPLPGVA